VRGTPSNRALKFDSHHRFMSHREARKPGERSICHSSEARNRL
jgi:hypothetical protein